MNNEMNPLCEALVAASKAPFGEIYKTMDRKTALACMRLASRIADDIGNRWQSSATDLNKVDGIRSRKLRDNHYKFSRLMDSANHADAASAGFREVEVLMLEMERIAPWPETSKKELE